MKGKTLLAGALLLVSSLGFTQSGTVTNSLQQKSAKEIITEAPGKAISQLKQQRLQEIIKEAANVVVETNRVIELINEGKIQEASVLLDRIASEMDKLIKEYGVVKVPINITFQVYTFNGDLNTAKRLAEKVKEAVNNNDFVDARTILNFLRDEIDIVTTYMPLYLYNEGIKLAKDLLKQNKVDAALLALQSALETLEIETVIVPRSLLEAQVLLEDAKQIYKTQPKKALALLERIKLDIEKAKVLGYISSEKEVEPLLQQISELEKAIKENLATTEEQFKQSSQTLNQLMKKAVKTTR